MHSMHRDHTQNQVPLSATEPCNTAHAAVYRSTDAQHSPAFSSPDQLMVGQLSADSKNLIDERSGAQNRRGVKISVITVTGHHVRSLADCLDSVQSQTYRQFEHVVIDNARLRKLSQRYMDQHSNQVTLVAGLDGERHSKAWNRGIDHASGEVLVFLNANDLLDGPEVLTRVAQAFKDPWLAAVYGNVKHVQQNDPQVVVRHQRPGPFDASRLAWGWAPPTSALFVRRHWYQRIGGFSNQFSSVADYDATLRLFANKFFKSEYLDEPLVRQRIPAWRLVNLGQALNRPLEELRALRKAQLGGLPAVVWRNITKVGHYL